jgi:diguanylate cyclase (GGDEF)-like protein/PAS domain S-box-containing protein
VPLVTPENLALGTLCVIDNRPRVLEAWQLSVLRLIAEQVSHELALRPRATSVPAMSEDTADVMMQENEHTFRALFEMSPIGKVLVELDSGQIRQANKALLHSTRLCREDLRHKSIWDLLPSEDHALYASMQNALVDLQTVGPVAINILRQDGSRFPAQLSSFLVTKTSGRQVVCVVIQDVSLANEAAVPLSDAARRDQLTGLASRTLFMEQLKLSISRVRDNVQERFAVYILDVDHFKLINDTRGHEAGDELLKQITKRLRAELRTSDTAGSDTGDGVLSRFGGDEFLLLLNGLKSRTDAVRVADRLLHALAIPYDIFGSEVHSSASIGIVTSDQGLISAENVVRNADVAMFEGKRAGRARAVVFNESMHTRLTRHVTIATGLRRAIGTRELYLVYQPIVELATGRVVSAEALIRWQHPTLGPVSPAEFIPIAEESGLIVPLGRWVQQEACQALANWRTLDPVASPASISVNVSRAELALGRQLLIQLQQALEQSGLPSECLTLEVTEREVMRDPEATLNLMHDLRRLGIKLSMDDFGTGTSSLGQLRHYPFDTIKIDRSFVSDLPGSRDVLAVIYATIHLIENLGMTSLAEGVETGAQAAVLQSLGCRLAQGYLFSRPVPPERMLAAIATAATHSARAFSSPSSVPSTR